MYWFRRPPYLRWAAAALIFSVAAAAELRATPTVTHPFVAAPVAAGTSLDVDALDMRRVPAGVLPPVDVDGARAARTLSPGEPVLPSDLAAPQVAPAGWWLVPLPLPAAAGTGAEVRVLGLQPPQDVPGVVVGPSGDDGFGGRLPGLVAVPADQAAALATAAARDDVVVLIRP